MGQDNTKKKEVEGGKIDLRKKISEKARVKLGKAENTESFGKNPKKIPTMMIGTKNPKKLQKIKNPHKKNLQTILHIPSEKISHKIRLLLLKFPTTMNGEPHGLKMVIHPKIRNTWNLRKFRMMMNGELRGKIYEERGKIQ